MASWAELEAAAPEIAELGRARLFAFGPGLAYLGTVRADGGPRIHPVCVNLVDDRLYLLVIDSPKRRDLLRDGRFALHSFPMPEGDDEFYLTGRATHRPERELVERVEAAQRERGATMAGDELAFELDIERALYSKYGPRDEESGFPPQYLKWRASPGLR